jgi:hypothetical protein
MQMGPAVKDDFEKMPALIEMKKGLQHNIWWFSPYIFS